VIAPGLEIDKVRMMRIIRKRHLGVVTRGLASFGDSGVSLVLRHEESEITGTLIVSQAGHEGSEFEWVHASLAWASRVPTYEELCILKDAVYGPERYAYQVFASSDRHVSIHDYALHLWGRADGERALPDFGMYGTI